MSAMEPRKSSYLVAVVFASLLLSSMAGGHRKLVNKDDAESMETSESMQQLQGDDEAAAVVHERILKQVKMDDYGRYDPTPTMSKPHFKDIPN
ncbi:hypothetical protein SEVIR_5G054300v4 [Setaria viridis]|uniref:Uncharacterized protein n=2 Tax=Setaria TaxID=4554 RepID=K3XNP6_SETIT|nr:protein CASPARIAN STRIP INTEGRITY FACTOR 1 [Setaria italica]XP_034593316.1 protein CASPARIAN STRIP INTEGRITY FACTOR 1-like [Setaria viridis]RCV24063.1 hypothetical protein SETIT_5G054800v2 [Setaria italica]TKW12721.1 hypothetical protein SEVIR_5G054300v2 [Setaria viridis]